MVGLLAAGVAVFFGLSYFLVPRDFGRYGHYRAGALEANASRPLHYAGRETCIQCHSDVQEKRRGGKHAGIGCEACHGALASHAEGRMPGKPTLPDPRAVCLRCHEAQSARPSTFPQVVSAEHAPEGACTSCHAAHNPGF